MTGRTEARRIVVGVDGSAQADRAVRWAVREAELRSSTIVVVHCYVTQRPGGDDDAHLHKVATARLDEITARNRSVLDRVAWSAVVARAVAVPSDGLIAAADGADLVVVGARGTEGFQRLRLGSTGYRTAAHSTVPVAVISGDGSEQELMDARRPLVVGVDGSRPADRALHWAAREAGRRATALTVAHAYELPGGTTAHAVAAAQAWSAMLVGRAQRDVADGSISVETAVLHGAPAGALLERAGGEHLLVVGTRGAGRETTDLPFGSVSHQCLHHATGPTVVVP